MTCINALLIYHADRKHAMLFPEGCITWSNKIMTSSTLTDTLEGITFGQVGTQSRALDHQGCCLQHPLLRYLAGCSHAHIGCPGRLVLAKC